MPADGAEGRTGYDSEKWGHPRQYGPLDHPQRREGEIHMGRCWNRWSPGTAKDLGFGKGWQTARTGTLEPEWGTQHGMRASLPWFVQEAELAEAGVWDPGTGAFTGEWDDPGFYEYG